MKTKKCRYAPGDCVLARRPVGSLFITARDVPETWRLFRGVTRAPAYSAPRLRFTPGCSRDKRSIGSDGGEEGSSSVRSRAARMRDFEGPGSPIVVVGRRERPCRVGRDHRAILVSRNASVACLSHAKPSSCRPRLVHRRRLKTLYITHRTLGKYLSPFIPSLQ